MHSEKRAGLKETGPLASPPARPTHEREWKIQNKKKPCFVSCGWFLLFIYFLMRGAQQRYGSTFFVVAFFMTVVAQEAMHLPAVLCNIPKNDFFRKKSMS